MWELLWDVVRLNAVEMIAVHALVLVRAPSRQRRQSAAAIKKEVPQAASQN